MGAPGVGWGESLVTGAGGLLLVVVVGWDGAGRGLVGAEGGVTGVRERGLRRDEKGLLGCV